MSVPFFQIKQSFSRALPLLEQGLADLHSQSGWVNDRQVRALEQSLAQYTGATHAIATGNATDSLVICLLALGIGPGDEVIVPCYSFFASVSCVLQVGATPVFVDIEADSYAIDCTRIEACITPRSKAIMPVHLFRQMADMQALTALARRHGLHLVEDSAEAIGMHWNGVHAGLLGDLGVLSFFPTKTLGALGDAGLILTHSDELAQRVRQILDNGRDSHGIAQGHGFNSRMDDLQALWLRARLPQLEADIARRARLCEVYDQGLRPLAGRVKVPVIKPRSVEQRCVDYVYLIEAQDRDQLAAHLAEQGIGTESYYPLPLHLQPVCAPLGYRAGSFPVAERAAALALGLPLYADLSEADAQRVCQAICTFYAQRGVHA